MKQVNLYEAKTQLSKLIQEAIRGEEIVIAKNGEPQVMLVALHKRRRSDGAGTGAKYLTAPVDWDLVDQPLDEFAEYWI